MIEALTRVIFPPRCSCCGSFFHPPDGERDDSSDSPRIRAGGFHSIFASFLCGPCLRDFIPVSSPICTVCGAVFSSREGGDRPCGDCLNQPKRFAMARASGVYDRSFRILIHRLKYQGKTRLAAPLGALLLHALARSWAPADIDLVIPMPLHHKRLRRRGFNQTHLLVRHWPRAGSGRDASPGAFRVAPGVLVRSRATRPQTGLGKKERRTNIRNAFRVEEAGRVDGKRILLVDDVYTTGATVNECARVLRKAGAKRVDALTLARAP
ncbi:MAG: ComF family protein [Desulfobacterales bacterium]|nr:ComF family protein [Desulfobacterales bacterium]